MEPVSMNDGLEGRETIAFGLAAGEVAVFVLALFSAYALVRSGLPGAVAWASGVICLCAGVALAWGRCAGRPLLEWAVLYARFAVRTRHARAARWRRAVGSGLRRVTQVGASAAGWRGGHGARSAQTGAVVIPLALRRLEQRAQPSGPVLRVPARAHTVCFFSLAGGSGRTTLAAEVAVALAVRARAASAAGGGVRRVVLAELARRNPTAGCRLRVAPPLGGARFAGHESGLLVALAPATAAPEVGGSDEHGDAALEVLDGRECAGAAIVIVDLDCDLGPLCHEVLLRCDQVLVTVTATAGGVLDAYRSTAVLRRLGLRDRLGYVVNRWREGFDPAEVMADLRGRVIATIPDDPALVDTRTHGGAGGRAAAAIDGLAALIEDAAGLRPAVVARGDLHAG